MQGITRILSSKPLFAIQPEVGVNLLLMALFSLKNGHSFEPQSVLEPSPEARNGDIEITNSAGETIGRVRVISIHGPMTAADQFCGPVGTMTMARQIEAADANPDISGVLLDVFTPGGSVHGTGRLAAAIEAMSKPKVTFGNGLVASAGYRIAAASDKVVISDPTAELGSIGVMLHYLDFTKWMRNEGIEEVQILSSFSPDKNKFNFSEPSETDIQLIQSDMLDPFALEFREAVKAARPGISNEALTGNTYLGNQAIQLGMADYMGGFNDAVELVMDLSQSQKKSSVSMNFLTPNKALQEQHATELAELQEQHATELAEAKADYEAKINQEQANQKLSLDRISELENQVQTLNNRIEELSKAPANEIADPEGDEGTPDADQNDKSAKQGTVSLFQDEAIKILN